MAGRSCERCFGRRGPADGPRRDGPGGHVHRGADLCRFAADDRPRGPAHASDVDSPGNARCVSVFQRSARFCRRDSSDAGDQLAGYQFNSDGVDLLDSMWLSDDEDEGVLVEHQQRQEAESTQSGQEASEDARVDDILARLHDSSWDALSPEEVGHIAAREPAVSPPPASLIAIHHRRFAFHRISRTRAKAWLAN